MTSLHILYKQVKQQVAEAVDAVHSATDAAAQIVQQAIQNALSAVRALDDYLDFFGIVGAPMDAAVSLLINQLINLAITLDYQGYHAQNQQLSDATYQYRSAKSAYNGFVGGMGGTSSGGGASGHWGEQLPPKTYPWFVCHNRHAAILHSLGAGVPPSTSAIDYTVLLGPCSEVFVYTDDAPQGYWQAGIYQYARLQIWVRFIDVDVIFDNDWGESPAHPEVSLGYNYTINDRSDDQYFRSSYNTADWTGVYYNQPTPTWPYDMADRVLTKNGDALRDVTWDVLGRHTQWGHDYWLYNLSYWEVREVAGIPDGLGGYYNCGQPAQLQFINPCVNVGKDVLPKPIPIPIPIPIIIDDRLRRRVSKTLKLGLDLRPYDILINGRKLTCGGAEISCGDTEIQGGSI